jgi:hypothetical protein
MKFILVRFKLLVEKIIGIILYLNECYDIISLT